VFLAATTAVATGCAAKTTGSHSDARTQAGQAQQAQVIEMSVTSDGFVPPAAKVKAGQPVRLVITRKTDRTCATDIVIREFHIKKPLPLNRAVEVIFTPTHTGTIRYACAMDMISGTLTVQ
jgi:plastocyanin domain-containing protein